MKQKLLISIVLCLLIVLGFMSCNLDPNSQTLGEPDPPTRDFFFISWYTNYYSWPECQQTQTRRFYYTVSAPWDSFYYVNAYNHSSGIMYMYHNPGGRYVDVQLKQPVSQETYGYITIQLFIDGIPVDRGTILYQE